ncbi:MAG: cation-translocating P-type ATPase [Candidatus Helarchaeota archaeon]
MSENSGIEIPFHSLTTKQIFEELASAPNGLSEQDVQQRIQFYGLNELPVKKRVNPIILFLRQFHNILIYILLVATIISIISHEYTDVYIIIGVIVINAVMGFIQENKAERAIEALKKLLVPVAKVIREGEVRQIQSRYVVPGDILLLEDGDKIPADARLLEIKNFRTIEASLTGESFPSDKMTTVMPANTLLADRKNMVWMGTFVASGEAKAIVVNTGNNTAISRIAQAIEKIKVGKGHLEKKVSKLVKQIGIIAIVGALAIFLIAFFGRGFPLFNTFQFALASLVSSIPEGLPIVLIIVLSIGANRMAQKCAIVRRLPAVETLDATTLIATDKTGTLTQNTMTIQKILLAAEEEISVTGEGWEPLGEFIQSKEVINPLTKPSLSKLLHIAALCNNAIVLGSTEANENNDCFMEVCACRGAQYLQKYEKYQVIGDPTEASLVVVGKKAGFSKKELIKQITIVDTMPFNPDLKFRASLIETEKGRREIYVVGAPEIVLQRSRKILVKEEIRELTSAEYKEAILQLESLAEDAMRVLGLAYKEGTNAIQNLSEEMITDLIYVGMVGIIDPPRMGVKEAIERTKKAGIRVIMQTGDHKNTAVALAKKIGLIDEKGPKTNYPLALTGAGS